MLDSLVILYYHVQYIGLDHNNSNNLLKGMIVLIKQAKSFRVYF